MKSSNKQFDDLLRQKLQELNFEPDEMVQERFLKQIQTNKRKLARKTWGKLGLLLVVVSAIVLLQHKIKYRNKKQSFQAQTSYQSNFNFSNSSLFSNDNSQQEPNKKINNQLQLNINALVVLNESSSEKNQPELLQLLKQHPKEQSKGLVLAKFKTAPSIGTFFRYEGAPLVEQKAALSETIVCGQNREKTKIIIARSRVANFKTDSLATADKEGVYRPSGFDEDAVIQYTVFDKNHLFRRFQAETIHWGVVRTTKIGKPGKASKQEAEDIEENEEVEEKLVSPQKDAASQKPKKTKTSNKTDANNDAYNPKPTNIHLHGTRQYLEPEYETYNYFLSNDSLIFISDKVNYVVVMLPDGTILSKAQIEITEPYVYYLGEKRAFYDTQSNKTYICVATLYHFNFYELEPANGKTKFLFQLDDVWPNPDFQINNGMLSYTYKGRYIQRSL